MRKPLPILLFSFLSHAAWGQVGLLAGVDFELATDNTMYDQVPDDLDTGDQITVSDWSFTVLSDGSVNGNGLRNDGGATGAGATTPNFPSRLEGNRTGLFSITIPPEVVLDLDRIEFDVRGATGGAGRDGQFRTSLNGEDEFLWEDFNLPGRTTGNWQRIVLSLTEAQYQGLTDQTVSFIWFTPGGAIDLDTIEVYGSTGTDAGPLTLSITNNDVDGGFDFAWNSRDGKAYDLVSSIDLSIPLATWPIWDGNSNIASSGAETTLTGVQSGDSKRFFAIVEKDPVP